MPKPCPLWDSIFFILQLSKISNEREGFEPSYDLPDPREELNLHPGAPGVPPMTVSQSYPINIHLRVKKIKPWIVTISLQLDYRQPCRSDTA